MVPRGTQREFMNCPIHTEQELLKSAALADHFLSKESFTLWSCPRCGIKKTWPIPDELGKYYESDRYLSHGDQESGLFARLYRLAKRYNLSQKSKLLKQLAPQSKVLDYGCGTGDLIHYLQGRGFEVRGAEPSAQAKSQAKPGVVDCITSPEQELASDRDYDVIMLWHVLEHIPVPDEIIQQLRHKLKEGGHLIIAVPNHESHDAQHYGAHWAAWDVPRHLWHFSPSSLIPLIESCGLKHKISKPMWLDAYYVSMLSEEYKGGNNFSALYNATLSNIKALKDTQRRCSSQVYVFKAV